MDPLRYLAYLNEEKGKLEDISLKAEPRLLHKTTTLRSPRRMELQHAERLAQLQKQFIPTDVHRIDPLRSVNLNRTHLALASLDAMFILSGVYSLVQNFNTGKFNYLDLHGGPGEAVRYLQFRRPGSEGLGISPSIGGNTTDSGRDYEMTRINTVNYPNFEYFRGTNNSGLLVEHSSEFIQYSHQKFPEGVDLVVGYSNSDLLLAVELGTALTCLKENGHLVIQTESFNSSQFRQLSYIMAMAFESFFLYRSFAVPSIEPSLSLVGLKRRPEVSVYIELCKNFQSNMSANVFTNTFSSVSSAVFNNVSTDVFTDEIEPGFERRVIEISEKIILEQLQAYKALYEKKQVPSAPRIDRYLAFLALPANRISQNQEEPNPE